MTQVTNLFRKGGAIRKVITRSHRMSPSLVGQPVEIIEGRLKEEEDAVMAQLHLLGEQLTPESSRIVPYPPAAVVPYHSSATC